MYNLFRTTKPHAMQQYSTTNSFITVCMIMTMTCCAQLTIATHHHVGSIASCL
jgi:hypothetical protein